MVWGFSGCTPLQHPKTPERSPGAPWVSSYRQSPGSSCSARVGVGPCQAGPLPPIFIKQSNSLLMVLVFSFPVVLGLIMHLSCPGRLNHLDLPIREQNKFYLLIKVPHAC